VFLQSQYIALKNHQKTVGECKQVEEFKAYLTAGETKNDVKEARRGYLWVAATKQTASPFESTNK
jgi:hypothetical protein